MDKRSFIDLYGVKYPHLNDNPQYLAAQIGRAFNTVLAYAFRNNLENYDLYSKTYTDIEVLQDTNGTYYSNVPVRIMQLPDNAESVRRITATQDQKTILFMPVPKDSWSTFDLLDVSKVSKSCTYSITNNRVEFAQKPATTRVAMDVVRTFLDIDDNEEISIPSGMEQLFEDHLSAFINGTPAPNKTNV